MTLKDLLTAQFVDTVPRSTTGVGIEVELPIVPIEGGIVPRSLAEDFTAFAQTMGFHTKRVDNDGVICDLLDESGMELSFETTWNTLEFSLPYEPDLLTLYERYRAFLLPIQDFFLARGYFLCGRGVNPNYAKMDPSALNSSILQAKSQYLARYTKHHDGDIFHALCASVQTQMDAVDLEHYLKLFSLLRRCYVFEALFFANSPPVEAQFVKRRPALAPLSRDTLCYRDELWKYCGAPNITLDETPVKNKEDFLAYLERLKLFIAVENGQFRPMPPTALRDYCSDPDWIEEMLTCFRSLEPVAPTSHGTLEVRSTCVQPLDAMLEPAAFYTGLTADMEAAEKLTDEIYARFFPGKTVAQVRDALMCASNQPLRDQMKDSAEALLDLAQAGLRARRFGEERLLAPLCERWASGDRTVPAQRIWENALAQTQAQMCNLRKGIL